MRTSDILRFKRFGINEPPDYDFVGLTILNYDMGHVAPQIVLDDLPGDVYPENLFCLVNLDYIFCHTGDLPIP